MINNRIFKKLAADPSSRKATPGRPVFAQGEDGFVANPLKILKFSHFSPDITQWTAGMDLPSPYFSTNLITLRYASSEPYPPGVCCC